jgi:hypothetical protein
MHQGTTYVVVAFSPVADASAVVGPFRSYGWAKEASKNLMARGYNTEICPLTQVEDVPAADVWDDGA